MELFIKITRTRMQKKLPVFFGVSLEKCMEKCNWVTYLGLIPANWQLFLSSKRSSERFYQNAKQPRFSLLNTVDVVGRRKSPE